MKIRNKETGEIIDLSNTKEVPKSIDERTSEKIKERGTIQESVKSAISGKSIGEKIKGGLEVIASPLSAIESSIANPSLEMQKGNFGPKKLLEEAIVGLTLQKQGQYGDVMKNAGYNPILSDTLGVVLNLSPGKVYSVVAKRFGDISKMSDKGLEKAGENLLYAVNEAKNAVGTKVTQEFAKTADNLPVDGLNFIDDTAKLPVPVMKRAEEAFGNLADFANGLTVGKLREFKRFLGKLKPNDYDKAEKGLAETLDVQDLNKVYSNLKGRLESTLAKNLDKKTAEYLMGLEDSFHEVSNAGRFIRKSITDPILRKTTKVGEFAEKVAKEGNSSARVALSDVKRASGEAMRNVNKAMEKIESFSKWQTAQKVATNIFKTGVYGGVAGTIAGRISNNFNQSE